MTNKKQPKAGPELPPGKACFPQPFVITQAPPAIKPVELDPQTRKTRSVPIDELHRRTNKHAVRSMQVRTMVGMAPAAFKKKYGDKKTLDKIYELVAKAEGRRIPASGANIGLAIKKSCDLVDAEIRAGNGYKYFVADWPPRKLGKNRPRSR